MHTIIAKCNVPSRTDKSAVNFVVRLFQDLKMTCFVWPKFWLVLMPLSIFLGMSADVLLELEGAADCLLMRDRLPACGDSV
jgi:hypothetical protein